MISNEALEAHLLQDKDIKSAHVSGDGYHYELHVVSDAFIGKTPVARQQWVYAKLKGFITGGSLHAISMKTLTVAEWEKAHG